METLLTLSLGEYSGVEIALRLTVALIVMTALILALTASSLPAKFQFPLFLSAVALGGAAWFEVALWQSWKEAFELAGTSYCVTGQLIADENRIIAWSLGVPAILFSSALLQIQTANKSRTIIWLGLILLFMALVAPFSSRAALITFILSWAIVQKRLSIHLETKLLWGSILIGIGVLNLHPSSLGGGPSGELARGEILRSLIDILSLVIPALLLLIGVLRISRKDSQG
jgi:uncharacterized membrane protein